MAKSLRTVQLEHGQFSWLEQGSGLPLVLLHGWSMSHAVFTELAEYLSGHFRLLIPDLPGHGSSDPVEECQLTSYAEVLAAWLKTLNLNQVDLLGWSLGGQIALKFSAEHPSLIRRLILVSSTPRFCAGDNWVAGLPPRELRALRMGLQKKYLATMGDFFDLQFKGEDIQSERRRNIIQFAVRPVGLPDPNMAMLTLDVLGQEDLRPILNSIQHQTLVIHGEEDQIIPYAAGQYLSENLPHANLATLPGIGHAPFLSRPELVTQLITEFCR